MKIGVLADCFRDSLTANMVTARRMGAQGVQLYAVEGATAPENMTAADRRELRAFAEGQGLEFSALCGDLGFGGFAFAGRNPEKIERTKKIIDLALDLGCGIVTTHIGVVPADGKHPRRAVMAEALNAIGRYAESVGAKLACETGPEPASVLRPFLDSLDTRAVGVNLDPANLAMTYRTDFAETVRLLAPYIYHTHAKDGVLLREGDPDVLYGMVDAPEGFNEEEYSLEVPLGEGDVRWDEYLGALRDCGYDGYLTIERECGGDPEGDIGLAVRFLRDRLARL